MDYIVSTPCGDVRGCAGRVLGTVAYKGIRYATAGRWEYPKPVTHWDGVYDATEYGAACYQPRTFFTEQENQKKVFYYNEFRKGGNFTYSEDCLFLNIFTPENALPTDKMPVLVYIHGGGYTGGCSHERHFDGPVWPTRGIVGVTFNYRLGPWGFACLKQLKEEAGHTGNYGLFDQMTAIQWVKDNIASFGGDPENITIMGQSAGAASVQLLSCSPLTEGLFQKAIMSSGCGIGNMLSGTEEKSCAFWQEVMERCGCKTLEQFRQLPPEELYAAWQSGKKELKGGMAAVFPVEDGVFTIKGAKPHNIPYMAGTTSEDMAPPIIQSMARRWIAGREKPSYTWLFDRQLPGDDNGAWHSADLWYWFGTLENSWRPMEQKDYELSRQMLAYLDNFLRKGNPNKGGELPTWVASDRNQTKVMILGEKESAMGRPNWLKMIYTMLFRKTVGV